MIKIYFLLLASCFIGSIRSNAASALRSDTIDIRKTIIDFKITDFSSQIIYAKTTLDIKAKMNNVQMLQLDLQGLTTDSVKWNGNLLPFIHLSPDLIIDLNPTPLQLNDTALIEVYYHGIPPSDVSWGGFKFSGNYAYQIGVGFSAQPHSFGRCWHPCFDNFVERSAYEFYITTQETKMAICNGLLIDSTHNIIDQTKTWHWKLDQEIPSYLSCVSICNYVLVKKILNGNLGNVDALIACEPIDTNAVNGSFAHLQQSFSMLEQHFGTYQWPRVGYSLVPFTQGFMEHATNISFGRSSIDGTLAYENTIAHELAHHWWGNLVTCSTAGDMWLNEGFASYCESLHTEYTYDYETALEEIRSNHFEVLSAAHVKDNGYKSIANMDSLHTYGMTVYNKGADAIHTLRSYMGDALFFSSLQDFLGSHQFEAVNTIQLRDYLSLKSGIDLSDYFQNWILSPGFTHFSIDSIHQKLNGGEYDINVFLRQRKHQSLAYYNHVPLELGFYDANFQLHIFKLEFNGQCMEFNVRLPFNPTLIVVDPNSKISDAVTENKKVIQATGSNIFEQAKCRINVKTVLSSSDSSLLIAEHHWVYPDRFKNPLSFPGYVLNDKRYWRIDGIHLDNVKGVIQFPYDGTINNNYLDSTWIKNTEDSIRLFYRKDATAEWQFANDSLRAGGLGDKIGSIYSTEIKAGEYTLGIKRSTYLDTFQTEVASSPCGLVTQLPFIPEEKNTAFALYPNPTSDRFNLHSLSPTSAKFDIHCMNAIGEGGFQWTDIDLSKIFVIETKGMPKGIYFLQITNKETEEKSVLKISIR